MDWSQLPDLVLIRVLSYLQITDRCQASRVCKTWHQCLETPHLWRFLDCSFFLPQHNNLLQVVKKWGHHVTHLNLTLDQGRKENRLNTLAVLSQFSRFYSLSLVSMTIRFEGTNPLFYAGKEFVDVIKSVLENMGMKKDKSNFKCLDMGSLPVCFEDDFVDCIAKNCPKLENFNIINDVLICNVSPRGIRNLVQACRNLKELHVNHASLSDGVLQVLSQSDRKKMDKLRIICRRQEKYVGDLSSESWSKLKQANPDLLVDLRFDHTCLLYRIGDILKPEIPIKGLYFCTYSRMDFELKLVSCYYSATLEKLVVHTVPSVELGKDLLNVVRTCSKLHTLYVYCVLPQDVIVQIHSLCPTLKKNNSYILKWEMEPEPWVVGEEDSDLEI